MAKTESAKKAHRQSLTKGKNNALWKKRIKTATKMLDSMAGSSAEKSDILKELSILQKLVDKAAKNKVIHKNKANRLKSKYARKFTAQNPEPKPTRAKPKSKSSKS